MTVRDSYIPGPIVADSHGYTDIYGPSKVVQPSINGLANGKPSRRTRTVIQLSLCDSLPAYGPIADMTFSLARNGVCLNSVPRDACH